MSIYLTLAPIICVIGLILFFAVKANADLKEVGKWMFICGLFVTLFSFATQPSLVIHH